MVAPALLVLFQFFVVIVIIIKGSGAVVSCIAWSMNQYVTRIKKLRTKKIKEQKRKYHIKQYLIKIMAETIAGHLRFISEIQERENYSIITRKL